MQALALFSNTSAVFRESENGFLLSTDSRLHVRFSFTSVPDESPLPDSVRSLSASLSKSNDITEFRLVAGLSNTDLPHAQVAASICNFLKPRLSLPVCCNETCPSTSIQLDRMGPLALTPDFSYLVYSTPISSLVAASTTTSPFNFVNSPSSSLSSFESLCTTNLEKKTWDLRLVESTAVWASLSAVGGHSFEWRGAGTSPSGSIECTTIPNELSITSRSIDVSDSSFKNVKVDGEEEGGTMEFLDWKQKTRKRVGSLNISDSSTSAALSARVSLSPAEGYHPSVVISFVSPQNADKASKKENMDALIIHIPVNQHAFADPFQIAGLNRINPTELMEWLAYGAPDLEVDVSVRDKALMNGVFVVIKNVSKFLSSNKTIEIPLHMRYQPAVSNGDSYVKVPIHPVSVYAVLRNPSPYAHEPCNHVILNQLMKVVGKFGHSGKSIVQLTVDAESELEMRIPVGNKLDQDGVLWTLSTSVIVSCVYVMMAFVQKFNFAHTGTTPTTHRPSPPLGPSHRIGIRNTSNIRVIGSVVLILDGRLDGPGEHLMAFVKS
ncbi:hypothetical protein BDR26DRAFT_939554 [Obelidium mucronatum]|nr:hypothetical protein BDR26DRAFT_939554 [Obelidium mucronatum]